MLKRFVVLFFTFTTVAQVGAMPAEPAFKAFAGSYMIYGGGLGDPVVQSANDAKIAFSIRGPVALRMFNAMGSDVKDICTAGTGTRVRRKDKERLVCLRTPEGTYTCSFGFDLKSGRSIGGSLC